MNSNIKTSIMADEDDENQFINADLNTSTL